MDQALAEGKYRPYGYVCTGAIAYDPIANGGEGPAGQSFCITALENVASQVCLQVGNLKNLNCSKSITITLRLWL